MLDTVIYLVTTFGCAGRKFSTGIKGYASFECRRSASGIRAGTGTYITLRAGTPMIGAGIKKIFCGAVPPAMRRSILVLNGQKHESGRRKKEHELVMETHFLESQITFIREYRFCPDRKWRFDWCLPNLGIAIECEGAAWTQGRHTRGAGFVKDMEKYNYAALLGWRVLRFTPQQVLDGSAIAFIRKVLGISGTVTDTIINQ